MGTRALTHLKPYKIWIVTQFDGYPEYLMATLKKVAKKRLPRKEGLYMIDSKHEIRAIGKTKKEALTKYLGIDYNKKRAIPGNKRKLSSYDIFIEYVYEVTNGWEVKEIKK